MSEWSAYAIGDHVRLKSGGPEMIVEADIDAKRVFCTWRNEQGFVTGCDFVMAALSPASQTWRDSA